MWVMLKWVKCPGNSIFTWAFTWAKQVTWAQRLQPFGYLTTRNNGQVTQTAQVTFLPGQLPGQSI